MIQIIFVGSLLFPLISTYLLALSHQWDWLYLNAGLVWLAIVSYVGIEYLARHNKNVDWFLSLAILNLLLLTPELLLRQANFHYELGIQFGYPNPTQFESLVPDEELFWRLSPERSDINSLGFRGKEIELPKPPAVYRIVFLGDSVLYQGYPEIVETFLNAQGRTEMRFESVNLAIPGYSTYQGRILVDKYGDRLEPNLVLISYGWNDHWQAYGQIDSQKKMVVNRSAADMALGTFYQHSRVLQSLRYMLGLFLGAERPLTVVRVPIDEYRDNLIYIGNFFTARNVPVIFITPPTAHYALGVPDYLVEENFATDKESVVTLHRTYNQIVREVVATHNWLILDLEQEFASLNQLSEIFVEDGVHLTPTGSASVAKRVTDFIGANWPALSP